MGARDRAGSPTPSRGSRRRVWLLVVAGVVLFALVAVLSAVVLKPLLPGSDPSAARERSRAESARHDAATALRRVDADVHLLLRGAGTTTAQRSDLTGIAAAVAVQRRLLAGDDGSGSAAGTSGAASGPGAPGAASATAGSTAASTGSTASSPSARPVTAASVARELQDVAVRSLTAAATLGSPAPTSSPGSGAGSGAVSAGPTGADASSSATGAAADAADAGSAGAASPQSDAPAGASPSDGGPDVNTPPVDSSPAGSSPAAPSAASAPTLPAAGSPASSASESVTAGSSTSGWSTAPEGGMARVLAATGGAQVQWADRLARSAGVTLPDAAARVRAAVPADASPSACPSSTGRAASPSSDQSSAGAQSPTPSDAPASAVSSTTGAASSSSTSGSAVPGPTEALARVELAEQRAVYTYQVLRARTGDTLPSATAAERAHRTRLTAAVEFARHHCRAVEPERPAFPVDRTVLDQPARATAATARLERDAILAWGDAVAFGDAATRARAVPLLLDAARAGTALTGVIAVAPGLSDSLLPSSSPGSPAAGSVPSGRATSGSAPSSTAPSGTASSGAESGR
ncbi:DUF4439 domain-containing protein [Tersicoccus sp. MR15.9]|uniref:DUF4439 domain-containing protein n=1 Tax=Tersicoccus mangrovi TaxID=3121635 RepID=UPI002FE5632D